MEDWCKYWNETSHMFQPIENDVIPSSYRSLLLTTNVDNEDSQYTDPQLRVPWSGVIVGDDIWITQTATGSVRNYGLTGQPKNISFAILNQESRVLMEPTGIVSYGMESGQNGFIIGGPDRLPAEFLVVTRNGTIHAYNRSVDGASIALMEMSFISEGSSFTGAALIDGRLWIADFGANRVLVVNPDWSVSEDFDIQDWDMYEAIPEGYAPYNVSLVDDRVLVSYSLVGPGGFPAKSVGSGYISAFTKGGEFIQRLVSGGSLVAPYGMVGVPSEWAQPSGSWMVANGGHTGSVTIYDRNGNFLQRISDASGVPIYFPPLMGLFVNEKHNHKSVYWLGSVVNRNATRKSYLGAISSCRN